MKFRCILPFFCCILSAADSVATLPSLVRQAQAAEQENRLDDAVALYKRILRVRPGWASAELNLGLVYHSRGEHTAAIRVLTAALRHQPALHSARLFRGSPYQQTGRHAEAIKDLQEYLRHQADDPEALPILAEAHLSRGEPAEAAAVFATLARVTQDPAAWFRLNESYTRLAAEIAIRLPQQAGNSFRTALTSRAEPSARQVQGDDGLTAVRCGADRNHFGEANQRLATILTRPVKSPHEAAILGDTIRRLAQAAAARVLADAPDSSWAGLLRAQAAEEVGDTDAADREYRTAVASPNATPEMYVRYGQFQCRHGQYDAGLASYERALGMDPSNANIMGLIGEVHVLQHRPKQAIGFLQKALQADPRHTQTRLYLAQALTRSGRPTEAVPVLEAAPDDPDGRIHYVLSRTYMQLGDTEKARKAMAVFRQRRGTVSQ